MEWMTAEDLVPKLGDKGKIYSIVTNVSVDVEVVKNPFAQDEYLYWHFSYPHKPEQKGWARIMPDDLWIRTSGES